MKTQRTLTILIILAAVGIYYGSCMPFDLTKSAGEAQAEMDTALNYWPLGDQMASISDVTMNIVLYVPFGLLAGLRVILRKRQDFLAIGVATVLGLALSVAVEFTQLYSPLRGAGVHDVFANTLGALIGSLLAIVIGREGVFQMAKITENLLRNRPVATIAVSLGVLLALDAWFPFLPTLKMSLLQDNFNMAIRSVSEGLQLHPWHYWLIRQAGVYLVLTSLLACGFPDEQGRPSWWTAVGVAFVFALVLEGGKLFIIGRIANIANVAVAGVGAATAPIIGRFVAGNVKGRARFQFARLLLWIYVLYLQLAPGSGSTEDLTDRLPVGAEWLPFYHYSLTGRGEKINLLIQTLVPVAAMTIARRLSQQRLRGTAFSRALTAGGLAGLLGLVLEVLQLWIPHRHPTTGDVAAFALAGVLGSCLTDMYVKFVNPDILEHRLDTPVKVSKFEDTHYAKNDIRRYRF